MAVGGPMSRDTSTDGFGRSRSSHFFVFDASRPENFLPIPGARNGFTGSRQYVVYLRDTSCCQILDEYLPAFWFENEKYNHAWQLIFAHEGLRPNSVVNGQERKLCQLCINFVSLALQPPLPSLLSHVFPIISFLCLFFPSMPMLIWFSTLLLHLVLLLCTLQCFTFLPPSTPHLPRCQLPLLHFALPDLTCHCYCQVSRSFSKRTSKIHTDLLWMLCSLLIWVFSWHLVLYLLGCYV